MLLTAVPQLAALLDSGPTALTSWAFYVDALVVSFVLFFGAIAASACSSWSPSRGCSTWPSSRTRSIRCTASTTRCTGRSCGMTNRKFFT